MKWLLNILLGIVLFVVFLVIRFPYETLVERSIVELERATGATVTYTPETAGPLGVKIRNLEIVMASGARLSFEQARLRPTWSGLVASLSQQEGSARLSLNGGELGMSLDNIETDTGSRELGLTRLSGDLSYSLQSHEGRGDLLMQVPTFQAPIPIPEMKVELGAKVDIKRQPTTDPQRSSSLITADIRLLGGRDFSGEGTVQITAQAGGGPPMLNGTLRYEAQQNRGTLRISGTWENPTWSVNPSSS